MKKYLFTRVFMISLLVLALFLTGCAQKPSSKASDDVAQDEANNLEVVKEDEVKEDSESSIIDTDDEKEEEIEEEATKENEEDKEVAGEKKEEKVNKTTEKKEKNKSLPEKEDKSKNVNRNNNSNGNSSNNNKNNNVSKSSKLKVENVSLNRYASSNLNIRKEPSASSAKIGMFSKNEKVKVTGKVDNGWFRVEKGGKTGFVSGKYLSSNPVKETQVAKVEKPQSQTQNKNNNSGGSKNQQVSKPKEDNKATNPPQNSKPKTDNQKPKEQLIVEKMKNLGNSEQVIIVTTPSANSYKANLKAYEKQNGQWKLVYDMPAVVGRNGVNKQKEGDGKAPTGKYSFGTAFGTVNKPSGVSLPYKKTTDNDYWVDDVSSPDYNKWVTYNGNPKDKWKSFEKLKISAYKYAVVINYNTSNIQPGKGSAIFLHVWKSSSTPTSGCTAVSEGNMLNLLKWLKPNKNPVIIQGTDSYINSLAK